MVENQTQEIILDSQARARIALGMYQEWQEAIKPPLLTYSKHSVLSFEQWLNKIIREPKKDL